jgi:hypothetical protein
MIHVLLYIFFIAGYTAAYYLTKLVPTHWAWPIAMPVKALVYVLCVVAFFAAWFALADFLTKRERSRL